MHWFIINTEAFSVRGMKAEKNISMDILPRALLLFLEVFRYPYIILDESSKIKTNVAMPEHKKSSRCRAIKLLNRTGERTIMTGTLKSKSPLNVYDQFGFLDPSIFPESMYEFSERYCIMQTIRVGRGRRVVLSQKDYEKVRTRMINAWNRGGRQALEYSMASITRSNNISYEDLCRIIEHKVYTPFKNQTELYRRIKPYSTIVQRSDVFDIKYEYFVHNPIMRYATPSKQQRELTHSLVELGFTGNMVLGKAASLELQHRLQDVCNGFEPIERHEGDKRIIEFDPLDSDPKMEVLLELLDEIDIEDNQVAIFCTRLNLREAIIKKLEEMEVPFVVYDGDQKKAAEEAFESRQAMVFISTMRPSAYGLNSLANCDYAIYVCVDGETEAYFQSRHRLLRGQLTHPKFAYHICLRGSMEERQIVSLQTGVDLIAGTNDKSVFEIR